MSELITYDRDSAGIVTLTWAMPGRVNVLNSQSVPQFAAAVERVLADAGAVGAIVTSSKSDFIVGLDLNEVGAERIAELDADIDTFHALTRRMETGGKTFVAALTGTALGGTAASASRRRTRALDARKSPSGSCRAAAARSAFRASSAS